MSVFSCRTDALARSRRGAFPAAAGQNNRIVAAVDSDNWPLIGPSHEGNILRQSAHFIK